MLYINILYSKRTYTCNLKRFHTTKILIDRGKKKFQKTMLLVYFFYFWCAKSN